MYPNIVCKYVGNSNQIKRNSIYSERVGVYSKCNLKLVIRFFFVGGGGGGDEDACAFTCLYC